MLVTQMLFDELSEAGITSTTSLWKHFPGIVMKDSHAGRAAIATPMPSFSNQEEQTSGGGASARRGEIVTIALVPAGRSLLLFYDLIWIQALVKCQSCFLISAYKRYAFETLILSLETYFCEICEHIAILAEGFLPKHYQRHDNKCQTRSWPANWYNSHKEYLE